MILVVLLHRWVSWVRLGAGVSMEVSIDWGRHGSRAQQPPLRQQQPPRQAGQEDHRGRQLWLQGRRPGGLQVKLLSRSRSVLSFVDLDCRWHVDIIHWYRPCFIFLFVSLSILSNAFMFLCNFSNKNDESSAIRRNKSTGNIEETWNVYCIFVILSITIILHCLYFSTTKSKILNAA